MAKYRKKPVVIEAEQFIPEAGPWPEGVEVDDTSPTYYGIFTLEDTQRRHEVMPGDWIITGIRGEKYPCKPEIFSETYEEVKEEIV